MTDIILLALSTLPKEEKISEFSVEGTEFKGVYTGQMEPVIQFRLSTGKQNDIEIFALCTPEVNEERDNYAGVSSFEYFKNRVGEIAQSVGFTHNIKVTAVSILENSPVAGIAKSVNIIREMKNRGELWIDTHGGFRDVVFSLEAVVSLLKVDGIVPDKIFGIRYDNRKAVLINQKNTFEMFDFVSGMNEFIKYGRVDQLNKYYSEHKNDKLKEILSAMNTISDGTQECNPRQYVEGLNELGKSINNLDNSDTLLAIFSKYIKDSYGVLLDPRKRSTEDIIRRCVDKGLYQQALTLLETLMPEEFVSRKILYYDQTELDSIKLRYPKLKPRYEDDSNFVINGFVNSDIENAFFVSSARRIPDSLNQEKEYIEIQSGKNARSMYKPAKTFLDPTKVVESKKVIIAHDKNEQIELTVMTKVGVNDWRKIGPLFRMHKALKRCRNRFNHCDSDRPDMEDIIIVLKQYVELADELFDIYK